MFAEAKLAKTKVFSSTPHALLCASDTLNWSEENVRACVRARVREGCRKLEISVYTVFPVTETMLPGLKCRHSVAPEEL